MEPSFARVVATDLGAWMVRADAHQIVQVEYLGEQAAHSTDPHLHAVSDILDQAEREIAQFCAGERTEFTVPHALAAASVPLVPSMPPVSSVFSVSPVSPVSDAAAVPKPKLLTPFQRDVLAAVAAIPFGATATYGEIAAAVGRPRAVRAVGGACGANPVPLLVPCHRVVAAHGLGGYRYGQAVKQALLRLEGHQEN